MSSQNISINFCVDSFDFELNLPGTLKPSDIKTSLLCTSESIFSKPVEMPLNTRMGRAEIKESCRIVQIFVEGGSTIVSGVIAAGEMRDSLANEFKDLDRYLKKDDLTDTIKKNLDSTLIRSTTIKLGR